MLPSIRQSLATLVASAVVATLVASGAFVAPAGAQTEIPDSAPDMTDEADFTVEWPNEGDGYPGDQNPEGGSIEYYASGADAFEELDAEEGVWIERIIVAADWIDYSACDAVQNTYAFGLDRGNDDEGVQYDEDLIPAMEDNELRDDGLEIWFFDHDAFTGKKVRMMPEDAIVAGQGAGSSQGSCLTLTNEEGWYQIQGYLKGTVADNGDDPPSEDARTEEIAIESSNYLYVCECDNRAEAEEQLGQPPGPGGPTPTATATATEDGETPTATSEPATEGGGDTPAGTADPSTTEPATEGGETPTGTADPGTTGGNGDGGGAGTPTLGDGPGFTGLAAILALLAGALLAYRRN